MKIKYIAEDGTEFDREDLCAEYETRQNETLQDRADSIIGAYIKNKKGAKLRMTSADISEMENEAKTMSPYNLIDRIRELEDETQEVL